MARARGRRVAGFARSDPSAQRRVGRRCVLYPEYAVEPLTDVPHPSRTSVEGTVERRFTCCRASSKPVYPATMKRMERGGASSTRSAVDRASGPGERGDAR